MTSYKNKTVCVVDNGLFVELAITLAKDFGTVYYCCPWEGPFPKSNSLLVGDNVPGIERLSSFWPLLNDIDLFVFPDVYYGPLQLHLLSLGKRVWGSRMGEELELLRGATKEKMKDLGIPVGKYKTIIGIDALREHLKTHDDQYVKVSWTRGDFETFHSKNYKLIEPRLDDLEHNLGARKKVLRFIVEDAINPAVEVGYDGWTIDGRFAKNAMWGIEVKDEGFIMQCLPYENLPPTVRDVNRRLAPVFKDYGYRGFFSSEIRITKDGKGYVTDPCTRMGSPPGELFQVMVENWAEIMWEGADGHVIEPKFAGKWGAELLLHSTWADKNWQAVEFPASIRENIKLRNLTIIEGRHYVVPPSVGLPEIGAVVAVGETMDGVIKEVNKIANKIEGYHIDSFPNALEKAKDLFAELDKFGAGAKTGAD